MTPQQAVGLASRLFAVWLALASFQSWLVARAVQTKGLTDAASLAYSVPAIYWLAAVLLWFYPMSIAQRLVPRTRFDDRMTLPARQVVLVACIVLGLCVILVRALPLLAAYLSWAILWIGAGYKLPAAEASRHLDLLEGVIQLLVGLACVLKAQAITQQILPRPARERATASALLEDPVS
jgi:hypothetical protein